MGFTKSVQPYWRFAIIDMQMTPRLSCHQRPNRIATTLSEEIETASLIALGSEGSWSGCGRGARIRRGTPSGEDICPPPPSSWSPHATWLWVAPQSFRISRRRRGRWNAPGWIRSLRVIRVPQVLGPIWRHRAHLTSECEAPPHTSSPASATNHRYHYLEYRPLVAERVADTNLGGRDRDRAVQRSTSLEGLDECRGARVVRPPQGEVERDPVERRHVGSRLLRPIRPTVNLHGDALERLPVRLGNDVNELDTARGDGRQERLDRRDLF